MTSLRSWGAGFVLILLLASSPARAQETADAAGRGSAKLMKLIHALMTDTRYGYRARPLDDAQVSIVFENFLDALDPGRLYFTRVDLHELRDYRASLDDAIRGGEQDAPRAIFRAGLQQVDAHVAFAQRVLSAPEPLAAPGEWIRDRRREPRPDDTAAREILWRQLLANEALELKLAGQSDADIRGILAQRYRTLSAGMHAMRPVDIDTAFINAYTRALDRSAEYFPARPVRGSVPRDPTIIGVGMSMERRGAFVVIHDLLPGGSAAKSGVLAAGDRLLAVGEGESGALQPVIGLAVEDVVRKTEGAAGSFLRLQVLPAGARIGAAERTVTLMRGPVALWEEEARASILQVGAHRVGVLDLDTFYKDFNAKNRERDDAASASRDLARELATFRAEGVDAVLLDLRGNGGGALTEAVDVSALFLGARPSVQIRESGGRVTVESGQDSDVAWSGPLAVLIDGRSAAASEIVAAAIRDHGRGLLLGERSFGQGTVQSLLDLDRYPATREQRFGMVKFTIGELFRPDGRTLDGAGVVPDVSLLPPSAAALPAIGMPASRRLPPAPGWERGGDAAILDALPALSASHQARMRATPEFDRWAAASLAAREYRDRNRLSLDESTRRVQDDAMTGNGLPDPSGIDPELSMAAAILTDAVVRKALPAVSAVAGDPR